jgi:predicted GNAT family acetyltransferase
MPGARLGLAPGAAAAALTAVVEFPYRRAVMTVRDDPARQRYELEVDDAVAFIDYRRDAGVVTMTHAQVPPALRGRGIGMALVAGALALVRQRGEKVVPLCPFVEQYMRRHPASHDLLAGGAAGPGGLS